MLIEIRQADIDQTVREDYFNCAIARAVKRDTGAEDVEVDSWNIVVDGMVLRTPPAAEEFINAFESGEPVTPFSFDLPIPESE